MKIKWKRLDTGQYELITKNFDFYASKNGDEWVLDIFDHKIKNMNAAYIESFQYDSFRDAKRSAETYTHY
jgi:hypothetical protein